MKTRLSAGFTLIELLVVITIIIILAGLAVGVVPQALERANQVQCLSNLRQVNLALRLYADDHDGIFPLNAGNADGTDTGTKAANANEAFRNLFPAYAKQEKIFYVGKSKWCAATAPDENFNGLTNCLKAGENDFGYVRGFNNTSNPNLPLVFNGLKEDKTGYDTNKNNKGGIWGGRKAVLARIDGSAEVATCDPTNSNAPTRNDGTRKVSIFTPATSSTDEWIASIDDILNPVGP